MTEYKDIFYQSTDGLRLYARDYAHAAPRGTVLCMHGLSRNSADFTKLCAELHDAYRIISVDQRGRGLSEYDPDPSNYNPIVYVRDMVTLLDRVGIDRVVVIGTSMGGVIGMLMASTSPDRVRGVVLNDIGPVIDPVGLDRIKDYVGRLGPVSSWEEAAAQARSMNAIAFPDYGEGQWLEFARNIYRENEAGRPVLAHDPAIARSLRGSEGNDLPVDLWPAFEAMTGISILVIRGATSDILAPECVIEMQRRRPDLTVVEIPGRGHAPMLDEAVAITAIQRFLDGLGKG
jgi:pimeloyl-ACP methyl ester carboxylesterase